jgi:hypothetical protein
VGHVTDCFGRGGKAGKFRLGVVGWVSARFGRFGAAWGVGLGVDGEAGKACTGLVSSGWVRQGR